MVTSRRRTEEQVNEAQGLWTRCTASLREQVSEATWQMWLSGVEPVSITDTAHEGVLVLGVPNSAVRDRVESRFVPLIEGTLASIAGQTVKVRLQVLHDVPPALTAQYPSYEPN